MDMAPGVDDESMMGLALALSLQEQPEGQAQGLNLQALALPAGGSQVRVVWICDTSAVRQSHVWVCLF